MHQNVILRAEGELFEALFSFSSKPTFDHAFNCFTNEKVQRCTITLAELSRQYALEVDRERSRTKEKPINYRHFYVGGVGIGLVPAKRSKRRYDWWAFSAFNTKSSQRAEKYCAEMRIMRAARAVSCACIGSIAVIGERQSDGRSGVIRPIGLDPCEACRDCMRKPENRMMFAAKTRILTGQPLAQHHSIETIPQMMAAHKEVWPKLKPA